MDSFAAYLRDRLPLVPVPGVAEIVLHLAVPASGIGRLDPDGGGPAPYWAYRWGGGLALARYLLDTPEAVRDRRVFDAGTGSGLVAIAAARAGAADVRAADVDARAAAAARHNAAANGVAIEVEARDVLAGPVPHAEVVLAGDLFYDTQVARRATDFLARCAASGCDVLVGDPWRAALPRARLTLLARIETVERAGQTPVASGVFRFA